MLKMSKRVLVAGLLAVYTLASLPIQIWAATPLVSAATQPTSRPTDTSGDTSWQQWLAAWNGALQQQLRSRGRVNLHEAEDAASDAYLSALNHLHDPADPQLGLLHLRGGSKWLNDQRANTRRLAREREATLRSGSLWNLPELSSIEREEQALLSRKTDPLIALLQRNKQAQTTLKSNGRDSYQRAQEAFLAGQLDQASDITGLDFSRLEMARQRNLKNPLVDDDPAPSMAARINSEDSWSARSVASPTLSPRHYDSYPDVSSSPYETASPPTLYAVEATSTGAGTYLVGAIVVIAGITFVVKACSQERPAPRGSYYSPTMPAMPRLDTSKPMEQKPLEMRMGR